MGILKTLKLVRKDDGQTANIFESLFPSFLNVPYSKPSEFVDTYWSAYCAVREELVPNEQKRRGVNGKIFEYIICGILIREKILPIFLNDRVAFVPNINFDILLYSEDSGPISLSIKTSFRERYKQADLEAMALKNVHRISKCFLITLSDADANSVSEKILKGETFGLDDVVVADSKKFDQFINELKSLKLNLSPNVLVIESNQIVTKESIDFIS
jgi:hypothetical protein